MNRRDFLSTPIALSAAAGIAALATSSQANMVDQPASTSPAPSTPKPVRLKQSICRWCFSGMKLEDLCARAAEIGYASVELLNPDEFDIPAKYGLTCALASAVKSNTIPKGFNRLQNHDAIIKELEVQLPLLVKSKIPQQIVFSGNRAGLDDGAGLDNCAIGLKRITPLAEKLGITLVMELLNSKIDHKDYMCDRTSWGVELVKRVGSPRFKLLYDIYHMQIMEGDIIRTINESAPYIGHYHTAGVPGRRDIDHTQELQYAPICQAIVASKFDGYLAQEFMPAADPIAALKHAFDVCNV